MIRGVPEGEPRRMFAQTLFNRLLFCWFLQKKGWLNHDPRYLLRLLEVAKDEASKPGSRRVGRHNFYDDYLYHLFFWAMNTPSDQRLTDEANLLLDQKLGSVPFLNGGLFEQQTDYDFPGKVQMPNDAFWLICALFERYNFTVTESTPFDIEVAIDPEMLGKVFEELVTGRHETGSYYTPRPVVSFMCREALKGYLSAKDAKDVKEDASRAFATFVDEGDPSHLHDPEAVLEALKVVKVCDPACGSGAYLVGMMQELLRLREALFAVKVKDYRTIYDRKLDIIRNNLYGVDKDPFAVNIAMLRLWLSLVVDDTRDPLDDPEVDVSLPNLGYKIECGDSLTAPNPQDVVSGGMFRDRALRLANDLADLKGRFMVAKGTQKRELERRIQQEESELSAALADSGNPPAPEGAVDWRVAFAEVFCSASWELASPPDASSQLALQGFDIVLANPPYVRQELLGRDYRENWLKPVFPKVYTGTADLYVYFFARAHELLRQGGTACFISSNKWLRAGYGEKLRQHLLDGHAFHLVVDFGALAVFDATAYPCIFLWQKRRRGTAPTVWAEVTDLEACYQEGVRDHVTRIANVLPASQFGTGKPRLAARVAAERRGRMEASGPRLGVVVGGRIVNGVKTGLNDAFVIDRPTRDRLVEEHTSSAEIAKPLLVGDDLRPLECHFRERFLLYVRWDTDIHQFPAVCRWLRTHRARLEQRDSVRKNEACPWYALSRPRPESQCIYEGTKIAYPVIATEPRFAMDMAGYYGNDKVFFIASDAWYLLGVLNSASVRAWIADNLSPLRGGYYEFQDIFLETLPIPDASTADREAVAKLAQEAQRLHTERRQRVEQFLLDLGTSPAKSSSRNPLEQPWKLTPDEFTKRANKHGTPDPRLFTTIRDETAALTEESEKVEREIDEQVAALYGL